MTTFSESRINDIIGIMRGTVGGAEYNTNVVVVQSGFEQRNQNWSVSRGKWDIGERILNPTELEAIIAFFRARKGKYQGFRFKDFADFTASYTTTGYIDSGVGTGQSTAQLYKHYFDGTDTYDRKINKPVNGTITLYQNGGVINPANYTIDYTTGIITYVPLSTTNITNITNASNGVVTTSTAHGLTSGNLVYISGVSGAMATNINNKYYTISVSSSTTFTLGVNTTSYGAYGSGGNVKKFYQAGDVMRWSGQFDIPVRFDTDELKHRLDEVVINQGSQTPYLYLLSLPIVEIRLT
jgi:uncharacterized protein (TIGR02217 family)